MILACQIQALGVSSKDAFPDNSFSAWSSSSSNVASKGRLNGAGAWSPSGNNNPNDYLQINLQYEFFICAVATQGKSTEDHWTTKYKLRLSLNSVDWVTYKENGTDKVGRIRYRLRHFMTTEVTMPYCLSYEYYCACYCKVQQGLQCTAIHVGAVNACVTVTATDCTLYLLYERLHDFD